MAISPCRHVDLQLPAVVLRGDDDAAGMSDDDGVTGVRYAIAVVTGVGLALLVLLALDVPRELVGADGAAVTLVMLAGAFGWRFPRAAAGVAVLAGPVGVGAAAQPLLVPSLAGLVGVAVLV